MQLIGAHKNTFLMKIRAKKSKFFKFSRQKFTNFEILSQISYFLAKIVPKHFLILKVLSQKNRKFWPKKGIISLCVEKWLFFLLWADARLFS